jgi:REP element-mobilizing transposase RayT
MRTLGKRNRPNDNPEGVAQIPPTSPLMPQSLARIYLHIVFSTKDRIPFLKDKHLRESLHAYMAGICKNLDSPALIIGGFDDHVHLLCRHSKNLALSHFLQELKRDSSKWAKTQAIALADFHWQNGYGAFSVSPSHVDPLKQYNRRRGQETRAQRRSRAQQDG